MIAGIAVIARHRRNRKGKSLPQISADKRRSEEEMEEENMYGRTP